VHLQENWSNESSFLGRRASRETPSASVDRRPLVMGGAISETATTQPAQQSTTAAVSRKATTTLNSWGAARAERTPPASVDRRPLVIGGAISETRPLIQPSSQQQQPFREERRRHQLPGAPREQRKHCGTLVRCKS
jgi:hypothetical protein